MSLKAFSTHPGNCTEKASKTNKVKVKILSTDVSNDLTIPKIVLVNDAICHSSSETQRQH